MKPIQSYIRNSALLLQYNQFHTTRHLSSRDNDEHDEKSTIGCDSDIDWTRINEEDTIKYKYWESSVTEEKNNNPYDDITDFNNFDNQTGDDLVESLTLTHTDQSGKLNMVDVGDKLNTARTAVAIGTIILGRDAFQLVKENKSKKGDVLTVAKIAGITGAKKTSELIPLCHNIPLSKVDIEIDFIEMSHALKVTCVAKTYGKTGVEMEAITGVAMATITIYDMCKAVTKDMIIGDIKLTHKSGGKSEDYYSSH